MNSDEWEAHFHQAKLFILIWCLCIFFCRPWRGSVISWRNAVKTNISSWVELLMKTHNVSTRWSVNSCPTWYWWFHHVLVQPTQQSWWNRRNLIVTWRLLKSKLISEAAYVSFQREFKSLCWEKFRSQDCKKIARKSLSRKSLWFRQL